MDSVEKQVRRMRKIRDLEIVKALRETTMAYPQIAKMFSVGESTVKNLARSYRCQRRVTPDEQVVELGNSEGWPAKLENLNKGAKKTVDGQ